MAAWFNSQQLTEAPGVGSWGGVGGGLLLSPALLGPQG